MNRSQRVEEIPLAKANQQQEITREQWSVPEVYREGQEQMSRDWLKGLEFISRKTENH